MVTFPGFIFKNHLYLDPGTGSMLLQLGIATFMGAGIAVRVYWKKIKNHFAHDQKQIQHNAEIKSQ
jgi:hypothetical protein